VFWIDANLAEDPPVRPRVIRHEGIRLRHLLPRGPLVVGAIDLGRLDAGFEYRALIGVALAFAWRRSRLITVDDRVQHVGSRSRDVDADAPAILRQREPVARFGPAVSAVGGFPDGAFAVAGLVARIAPLAPDALPGSRVQ